MALVANAKFSLSLGCIRKYYFGSWFLCFCCSTMSYRMCMQVTNTISLYKLTNALLLFICFKFFNISLKNSGTLWLLIPIPGFRDFSFFLSSTFVYQPILIKGSMTSKVIQGHIIQPFILKSTFCLIYFVLFVLLIDRKNKYCWTLWKSKDNIWLVQRQHLPCTKTTFALYKDDIG